MTIRRIVERPDQLVEELLALWEASVRATHDFLSEDDIKALIPLVRQALREIPILLCADTSDGKALGFMGIAENKIEMLFLAPEARGKGLGRSFLAEAEAFGVHYVDVNEQNTQGVGFYLHSGFKEIGRSPLDGQGNPFPILHLKKT